MTEETSLPADAPAPRLCHLIKWPDFDGYGFNLHAEKSKSGQFVGKVDDESPAQGAGLREGDRIIEVNGVNIANENHRQVVERIKANPRETKLLVIEESGDQWYKERGLVIRGSQANVVFHATPEKKPCIKVEANSGVQETQSRDKDEEVVIMGSTEAGTDCLNGESEPADSSPCLATLKSGTDSTAESEQQEKRQESKSVTRESEASVEPEIIGKSITEEAVVVVVGKSGNNSIPESSLQATDAILVMSPEPQVADQTQEKGEEAARAEENGVTGDSSNEADVAVSTSHTLPDAATTSQQKDSDRINNNNITIEDQAIKSPSRDVTDSVTVQVKANGVNSHPNAIPESSSGSPAVPASPTSLKSNSSGSTSGNALSSLGSGGEGNLEMSLNMSVSQMRQMLAQKKKVDPKKVAMDLKQKYEIISSM